jgi:3'(2'), 5'-bisphosphate nucleotidase
LSAETVETAGLSQRRRTKVKAPSAGAIKASKSLRPVDHDYAEIAEIFAKLAVAAGAAIMRVYDSDKNARLKPDRSPVCDADVLAEAIILKGLAADLPNLPVVAEEECSKGAPLPKSDAFILVDPVDGTREFLDHNGEFTVNIALVVKGEPRAGVIYAPALEKLWMTGQGAYAVDVAPGAKLPPPSARRTIRARRPRASGLVAFASRSHSDAQTEAFLAELPVKQRRSAGSSLKFCAVAEGKADVYPRFGPTMEWDTAAGDAILRAAGGKVLDPEGQPLRYGKSESKFKNGPFIAWGDTTPAPIPAPSRLASIKTA